MNQKKSGASCAAEKSKFKSLQRVALQVLVCTLILGVFVAWFVNLTAPARHKKIRSAYDTEVYSVSTPQLSTVDDEATTILKSWVGRDRNVAPMKTLKKEIRVKSSRDLPKIFDPIEKEYMQQRNESQKQQQNMSKKLAGTIKGTMTAQHTKDLNTLTVKVTVTLQRCDKKGQNCKEFASASFTLNRFRYVEYWLGSTSSGTTDATGTAAGFNSPRIPCMVTDTGLLMIPDYGNHKTRTADTAGAVTTFTGNGTASSTDGTGTSATHYRP